MMGSSTGSIPQMPMGLSIGSILVAEAGSAVRTTRIGAARSPATATALRMVDRDMGSSSSRGVASTPTPARRSHHRA